MNKKRHKKDVMARLRQKAKRKDMADAQRSHLMLVESRPSHPEQSFDDPEIEILQYDLPPGDGKCPGCGSNEQSHMLAMDYELPISVQTWWWCRGCQQHWATDMGHTYVDLNVPVEERSPIHLPLYPYQLQFKKLTAKEREYFKTIYRTRAPVKSPVQDH